MKKIIMKEDGVVMITYLHTFGRVNWESNQITLKVGENTVSWTRYFWTLELTKIIIFSDDKNKADLWLLNSCTVKNPAVDHFR